MLDDRRQLLALVLALQAIGDVAPDGEGAADLPELGAVGDDVDLVGAPVAAGELDRRLRPGKRAADERFQRLQAGRRDDLRQEPPLELRRGDPELLEQGALDERAAQVAVIEHDHRVGQAGEQDPLPVLDLVTGSLRGSLGGDVLRGPGHPGGEA